MFNRFLSENPKANIAFQLFIAVVASIFFGIAMKFFLIPGNIFSSGVSGLSQIINYFTSQTPLASVLTTGNLFLILNIPILILSITKLGRHFTIMTIVVVVISSIMTNLFPLTHVSDNPLVNAIVGGTFTGVGAGLTIKYGMSGGGFDVLTIFFAKTFGVNVGPMNMLVNSVIVMASGLFYDWETAIFTVITIYVTSVIIDKLHTGEQRLTAFIVTDDAAAVSANIRVRLVRSTTILEARGGYTGQRRDVLMVVINRYEFHDLQLAIAESDPAAFVNIIQSNKVMGQFLTRDQQVQFRKQALGG